MNVRPFARSDLEAAALFCELARARDPCVEPFGERLPALANAERARLSAWRVLDGGGGEVRGIAFAAARATGSVDVYAAVDPRLRRRGYGRALLAPSLELSATLRARVPEQAAAGRAFLAALGFAERSAQLSLQLRGRAAVSQWRPRPLASSQPLAPAASQRFEVRRASAGDEPSLRRLSSDAWAGAPDLFAPLPGDPVFAADRILWIAERDGHAAGYLAATRLGTAIAIEELAVLPVARRLGIARALVLQALQGADGAVLSVAEGNRAARALYESLGFELRARRLVYER